MRQVEVAGLGLDATTGAPLVVLREMDAPHRVLPIFVGGTEAAAIGVALAGQAPPRPLTYDLMVSLVESVHARIKRVEVTELRDGAFLAEIAVAGPVGDHRLDTRPSDAIALAIRVDAPVFVSDDVLDVAGTVPEVPDEMLLDQQAVDEQVAEFRTLLDDLDAADFETDRDAGEDGDASCDRPAA